MLSLLSRSLVHYYHHHHHHHHHHYYYYYCYYCCYFEMGLQGIGWRRLWRGLIWLKTGTGGGPGVNTVINFRVP
jgi:hypothetical protein